MRAVWIGLSLLLLGGAAWWVTRDTGAPEETASEAASHATPDGPALRGADASKQVARLAKEAARRDKAALRAWETREGKHATVIGRILDSRGRPIEKPEIGVLQGNDGTRLGFPEKDGRFDVVFEVEGKGLVRFVASAPGFVPRVLPWREVTKQTVIDLGTLRLKRGLRIEGRVVDQHGVPWDDSQVEIWPDDDPEPAWWYAAVTASRCFDDMPDADEQGRFIIAGLPPGRYRLRIEDRNSVGGVILEGQEAGAAPLTIVLERHVEEPEAGRPWSVNVRVLGAPWERTDKGWDDHPIKLSVVGPWRTHKSEQVGAELTAHFEGPDPVDFMLRFPKTAHPPIMVRNMEPPGRRIEVRLSPPTYLRGQILVPPGGEPQFLHLTLHGRISPAGVLDANVFEDDPTFQSYGLSALVDLQGRFEFRAVVPGRGRLVLGNDAVEIEPASRVVRTDGGPVKVQAFRTPRAELRFVIPPGAKVEKILWELYAIEDGGRTYLSDGAVEPRAKAAVHLVRRASTHILVARTKGHPALGPVEVLVPQGSSTVTVTFPAPRILAGQVVDAKGAPVPQVWVELVRDTPRSATWASYDRWPAIIDPEETRPGLTALDGSFRLAIPPEGRWHLVVKSTGHAMRGGPLPIGPAMKTTRVVMEPAQRITGRLTHLDPGVPGGYTVTAWPHGGGEGLRCRCDSFGYFQLHAVPTGRYTLIALLDEEWGEEVDTHYQAVERDVRAGTRGLVMPLRDGLTATLDLRDANGKPLHGARVFISGALIHWQLSAHTKPRTFTARGLPPGPHRFEIDVYGKGHHTVEAKPGKTVRYVIR